MKSLQYAAAGALYRKKFSIIFFIFTLISLFLLIILNNLMDVELLLFQQLKNLPNFSSFSASHQEVLNLYFTLYYSVVLLSIFFIVLLVAIYLKKKNTELQNLYLKGFSSFFIVKQTVLELLFPCLLSLLFAVCLTFAFTNTYSLLLVDCQKFINDNYFDFSRIAALTSKNTVNMISMTPSSSSFNHFTFFDFNVDQLSTKNIVTAFLKNSGVLFLLFTAISTAYSIGYTQRIKNKMRR